MNNLNILFQDSQNISLKIQEIKKYLNSLNNKNFEEYRNKIDKLEKNLYKNSSKGYLKNLNSEINNLLRNILNSQIDEVISRLGSSKIQNKNIYIEQLNELRSKNINEIFEKLESLQNQINFHEQNQKSSLRKIFNSSIFALNQISKGIGDGILATPGAMLDFIPESKSLIALIGTIATLSTMPTITQAKPINSHDKSNDHDLKEVELFVTTNRNKEIGIKALDTNNQLDQEIIPGLSLRAIFSPSQDYTTTDLELPNSEKQIAKLDYSVFEEDGIQYISTTLIFPKKISFSSSAIDPTQIVQFLGKVENGIYTGYSFGANKYACTMNTRVDRCNTFQSLNGEITSSIADYNYRHQIFKSDDKITTIHSYMDSKGKTHVEGSNILIQKNHNQESLSFLEREKIPAFYNTSNNGVLPEIHIIDDNFIIKDDEKETCFNFNAQQVACRDISTAYTTTSDDTTIITSDSATSYTISETTTKPTIYPTQHTTSQQNIHTTTQPTTTKPTISSETTSHTTTSNSISTTSRSTTAKTTPDTSTTSHHTTTPSTFWTTAQQKTTQPTIHTTQQTTTRTLTTTTKKPTLTSRTASHTTTLNSTFTQPLTTYPTSTPITNTATDSTTRSHTPGITTYISGAITSTSNMSTNITTTPVPATSTSILNTFTSTLSTLSTNNKTTQTTTNQDEKVNSINPLAIALPVTGGLAFLAILGIVCCKCRRKLRSSAGSIAPSQQDLLPMDDLESVNNNPTGIDRLRRDLRELEQEDPNKEETVFDRSDNETINKNTNTRQDTNNKQRISVITESKKNKPTESIELNQIKLVTHQNAQEMHQDYVHKREIVELCIEVLSKRIEIRSRIKSQLFLPDFSKVENKYICKSDNNASLSNEAFKCFIITGSESKDGNNIVKFFKENVFKNNKQTSDLTNSDVIIFDQQMLQNMNLLLFNEGGGWYNSDIYKSNAEEGLLDILVNIKVYLTKKEMQLRDKIGTNASYNSGSRRT